MDPTRPILAAGTLTWRHGMRGLQVLLVHRTRYDDWSFPKGKADPGEPLAATAARETLEETGYSVRLGIPLTRLTYFVDRPYPASKHVSYWTASARDADTDSPFVPNDEVDDIDWLSPEAAAERLTYHRDRGVLDDFVRATRAQAHHSRPLVILRHAAAEPRRQWPGPDATRPLTKAGRLSAEQLVPALGAYGIKRIVSSDASRCIETVEPYANERDRPIVLAPELSEDKATRSAVTALAESWRERHRRVVLCTHRPVLPWVFDALGLPDPALPPGGIVVAHRLDGVVVAVESPAHGGA